MKFSDGRTDGRTYLFIEMRGRIYKVEKEGRNERKKEKGKVKKERGNDDDDEDEDDDDLWSLDVRQRSVWAKKVRILGTSEMDISG